MAEQTLKEKTAKGLFWGGLSNGVQQVLNALFGLILARVLNASDYGMVGMLAIFSAIASTIQESGFTAALTNQKEIKHEDYNAVFWFSTLTGILFYLILFYCAPLIANFYDKPELISLSRVVFLGFLFGGFGIASNAYLFKTLMVKERAKIDIISLVCSGVIGVTLALSGFTYYGLAIQTVIYIGVGSLLKFVYAPWKPTFPINLHPLKIMFDFSLKLILTNICTQISNNIFSVVLGRFYSVKEVGYYSQGYKWTIMGGQFIAGMINNVAQPVFAQVVDDKQRQIQIFRKMVRFGAFLSFPSMLGLAFVAREFIVVLLGEKWLQSVPFLQLFCLWGCCGYLWHLYINLLISQGKSDIYLSGMVFTGGLQLLILFLMYPLGIYPMVVGYIISYYIGISFWHYHVNKLLGMPIYLILRDVMPYLFLTCLTFLIVYLLLYFVDNLLLRLFLKIFLSMSFYIGFMKIFGSSVFKDSLSFLKINKITRKLFF